MSPATLVQEIEQLDETQKNAVALFVRFLATQRGGASSDVPPEEEPVPGPRKSMFGALKGKMWISPDFDAPLEDFAEYM